MSLLGPGQGNWYIGTNSVTSTPANPASTTSVGGLMMGLAGTITPVSKGNILFIVSGNFTTATGVATVTIQLRTGTGTAPINGAALTGTTRGAAFAANPPGIGTNGSFTVHAFAANLSAVATWIDVSLATSNVADAASISNVTITSLETF